MNNPDGPRFLAISWIALVTAILLPPLGLVLGIVAIFKSRKLPGRWGNKAVAISSIATAAIMLLILAPMLGGILVYELERGNAEIEMERALEEEMLEQLELEREAKEAQLLLEQRQLEVQRESLMRTMREAEAEAEAAKNTMGQ